VASLQDEYRLEDLSGEHAFNAGLFIPFVIGRLQISAEKTDATLQVTLRNVGSEAEQQRLLRIMWSETALPGRPPAVPEAIVTEWAALSIACIAVSLYAGLKIQAVSAQGDRFDYWVSDGQKDYGLEVSGTLAGDIESRHAVKIKQWGDNPYGVDGWVVTVAFATRQVILSFHRFEEIKA
jgi:hypothetical protein